MLVGYVIGHLWFRCGQLIYRVNHNKPEWMTLTTTDQNRETTNRN